MEFGVQFFPDVGPEDKAPNAYFRDCLELVELADPLGYSHIRIVEHYFGPYGGYSPNPVVFLAAASQRTRRARLVTGAIIPAFNHPLKVAAEIAMLDGICDGRLDVGFARAFIPAEFAHFGVPIDESVERYREAIEQIDLLLRTEDVTHHGTFHSFEHVTSLPRPTQQPRPKFIIAATVTPESFEFAGRNGYGLMVNPLSAPRLRELGALYRKAYGEAGHPGNGEIMLAFHMFVDEDGDRARRIAKPHIEGYFRSLAEASAGWGGGTTSSAYKGYDKKFEAIRAHVRVAGGIRRRLDRDTGRGARCDRTPRRRGGRLRGGLAPGQLPSLAVRGSAAFGRTLRSRSAAGFPTRAGQSLDFRYSGASSSCSKPEPRSTLAHASKFGSTAISFAVCSGSGFTCCTTTPALRSGRLRQSPAFHGWRTPSMSE
jgi:alkanesulfonate monooxygenase SsuD/methylene tetrahydromethanopterin reductase-like flavin-dependent oxidoreductase (luciferase family)